MIGHFLENPVKQGIYDGDFYPEPLVTLEDLEPRHIQNTVKHLS